MVHQFQSKFYPIDQKSGKLWLDGQTSHTHLFCSTLVEFGSSQETIHPAKLKVVTI